MAHKKRRNVSRSESRRRDPLIGPGGKVDPAAVFRAANSTASTQPEVQPPVDDDLELGDDDIIPAQPTKGQRVSFTLTRDLDKRLDKYLTDRITFLSRNKLQELIDTPGRVTVNARPAKASTKLRLGDVVDVHVDAPPSEDYPPQDIPLDVMYEDEHMIVLNKSPDIIVHPARTHTQGTLINALAFHFRNRSKTGGDLSGVGSEFARPGVVHRLDRQTSGVIIFAKSDTAHWKLAEQFEKRSTDKRYLAFVHGKFQPAVDTIDFPIGPHPSREKGYREKQVVRHDHLGKPALTVCRVLGQYLLSGEAPISKPAKKPRGWTAAPEEATTPSHEVGNQSPWVSLLEVELKTGRTHQIRVHCSHRGHPLLGDDMYGGRLFLPGSGPITIERVALHAAMLELRHPISREKMTFVAPLPQDLRSLLSDLRRCRVKNEAANVPAPPGAILTLSDQRLFPK